MLHQVNNLPAPLPLVLLLPLRLYLTEKFVVVLPVSGGGRTALDYLIKVRGMDFVGAVEALCGYRAPPPQERPKPKPPKPFELPKASRFPSMMLAYLQGRGIHPELLQTCIQAGTLYESQKYQNCVFVGRDPMGRARFACLRGTRDNFRIDAEGSDKRYNFPCWPLTRSVPGWRWRKAPLTPYPWLRW